MIPLLSSPQWCHAERGLSFATAKLNRLRSTPTPAREMACSATGFTIEGFERARPGSPANPVLACWGGGLQPGRYRARKSGALAPEGGAQ